MVRTANRPRDAAAIQGYAGGMKPEPSSAIDQGRGQQRRDDKTGKTVPARDIPPENRAAEGVDEGIAEGAAPSGTRHEPHAPHHLENRPGQGS